MYNLGFLYLPATSPPRPSDGSPCYFSLSTQALDFHSRTKAMKFLPYVDFPRSVLALRIPIRGGLAALARDIIKIAQREREFFELNFLDKRPEIVMYIYIYFFSLNETIRILGREGNGEKCWKMLESSASLLMEVILFTCNWIIKSPYPRRQDRGAAFRFIFHVVRVSQRFPLPGLWSWFSRDSLL